jgi:UDP-N-acetylmuramoyl-tripeptide--D-alanyl-D-alanine ligase
MIESIYSLFKQSTGVCTDTRKIKEGCLFFALKGENFNGNKYAKEAIAAGAMGAIVDDSEVKGDRIQQVENVLETLQHLANHHRKQFDIPVLALTGSNGKTTTKELIASVLSQKYRVHFTAGNLNNHIGVPLTLLSMPEDTEIAIIEMGANHQGEIKMLSEIASPNYGLITNIGKAHLEGFGGVEGVKKGKLELYDFVSSNDGSFFVNLEDEILNHAILKNRIDHTPSEALNYRPHIEFYHGPYLVRSALFGKYNYTNIQMAVAVGAYFKVEDLEIAYGIESYIPDNNRSELIRIGTNEIIMDAYNANPSSMKASLNNFNLAKGKKIAILGSMKELGKYADKEHEELIKMAQSMNFEELIFYGNEFKELPSSKTIKICENIEEIKASLNLESRENYKILLKGSRSTTLERIFN